MKSKAFAIVTVVSIILLVIFSTLYIEWEIDKITLSVDRLDTSSENAAEEARRIRGEYKSSVCFISLFVTHDDLTNIEDLLAELDGCLRVGDAEEAEVVKNRLISSLEHLRRLSGMNLEAII
jgi:hypothetical protein